MCACAFQYHLYNFVSGKIGGDMSMTQFSCLLFFIIFFSDAEVCQNVLGKLIFCQRFQY